VSPNSVVGHFSPLADDATELADGDLVKMCVLLIN
jgi:methionine aminopeptidase